MSDGVSDSLESARNATIRALSASCPMGISATNAERRPLQGERESKGCWKDGNAGDPFASNH